MNCQHLSAFVLLIFLISCSGENQNAHNSSLFFETDSISLKLKYAETSFIVPSPNQTAILLKRCDVPYDDKLMTASVNLEKYTTTIKKALALGVLGADLSYLNLYDQRELALRYLQDAEALMNDLQISQSLDKTILKKIETNFGNNDSVLYYLASLYRNGDLYLKANDRRDICSLIIAGGWIESFYFLTTLYTKTKKEQIFDLILYQSDLLDNLIKILSPYYEKTPEFMKLIDELVNIAYEFDVVDKTDKALKTETDTVHRKTIVYNQRKQLLTGSRLENLARHATVLRNKIVLQ